MNFLLQIEHTLNKIMPKNNDQKHCRLLRTKIVNLALNAKHDYSTKPNSVTAAQIFFDRNTELKGDSRNKYGFF